MTARGETEVLNEGRRDEEEGHQVRSVGGELRGSFSSAENVEGQKR